MPVPAPDKIPIALKKLVNRAVPPRVGGGHLGDKPLVNPGVKKAKLVIYQTGRAVRRQKIHDIFKSATLRQRAHGLFKLHDTILSYKPFAEKSRRAQNNDIPIPISIKTKRMKAFLQIITTPTADTPGTTLLLHFDDKRYLLGNVSEGTQRACVQRRINLSKISNVFLTGTTTWQTTGGLLGIILTVADTITAQTADKARKIATKMKRTEWEAEHEPKKDSIERSSLLIHGGKNLTHLLATARRFVFRKGTPIDVEEIEEGATKSADNIMSPWKDSNIRVWAMSIQSSAPQDNGGDGVTGQGATEASISEAVENVDDLELETKEQLEERNMQFRRGVIGHMFDSKWRLDSLQKLKLLDVKLPATIFIRKPGGGIEEYKGPLPTGNETVPNVDVLVRTPWPGAAVAYLPPTKPSNNAISYIVKTHAQRGRFQPDVAIKLGVKPGPSFAQLAKGKTVTTKEGNLVTPEMVLGPGRNGHGFAVVEIPSTYHIDGLVNREEWTNKELMEDVETMIWILGKDVAYDARIIAFMNKHEGIRHLVSSTDVSPNRLALESPAQAAIRLNQVDPQRFPVPAHSNVAPTRPVECNFQQAKVGAVLNLEPKYVYDEKFAIPDLDTAEVVKATDESVLKLAEEARTEVNDSAYQTRLDKQQHDLPCKDAEVITLGTGSALPSKYRNVSATLLRVPGYGNYLFDCGENTLGQLKRVFGAELPQVLRDLKVIWISHLHADHHLGTVSVIKAWHDETREAESTASRKLIVASDTGMIKWLSEYAEVEDYGHERLYTLSMNELNNHVVFSVQEGLEFGLSLIRACRVSHCLGALAVVFEFPNRLKVAYSGDCRPSEEFARIGKGATLLIHEATFDDELQGDAIAKKHCTTAEALEVGRKMGARRILLTHFSQRYQKIPVMYSEETDQIAIVAFDYMRCRLADFAKLAAYRPALLKLYEEKEDDQEITLVPSEPLLLAEE